MSRASRMYKDSPKMERGEDGEMAVSKKKVKNEEEEAGAEGSMRDHGMDKEMEARHVLDRHHMYAKHEHEHAMHKGGDKKEMHERHHADMKAMHKKHDKEMEGGNMETEGEKSSEKKKEEKHGEESKNKE